MRGVIDKNYYKFFSGTDKDIKTKTKSVKISGNGSKI